MQERDQRNAEHFYFFTQPVRASVDYDYDNYDNNKNLYILILQYCYLQFYYNMLIIESLSSSKNVLSMVSTFSSQRETCFSIADRKSSLAPLFTPRVTVRDL